jgi:restriction system protein
MVPKFDSFMYPALEYLKDGQVRTNKEIYAHLRNVFKLTDEDMDEKVEKGGTSRAIGNMSWALTFLFQAGLTQKEKRGYHQISKLGKELLADSSITDLTEKLLVARYGDDKPFFNKTKTSKAKAGNLEEALTPNELAREAVNKINEAVASDLLSLIQNMDPKRFEYLVVELLVKMGYGGSIEDAASVTQYSKDEGVDGVIKEDSLGLDTIYIQAKRWKEGSNVGRKEIQAFVGALVGKHSNKGVFMTTAQFTNEAIDYAKNATGSKIILIDGRKLCQLMMQYNLGVSTKEVLEVKRIDTDYFDED